VLPAQPGGFRVHAQGRPDVRETVRRDAHADSRTADQDPPGELPRGDAPRDLRRDIRIIDGFRAEGPDVVDGIPEPVEEPLQRHLQIEAGVVRADHQTFVFRHDFNLRTFSGSGPR